MNNTLVLLHSYYDYMRGCGLSEKTIKRSGYLVQRFVRWLSVKDFREVERKTILEYVEYLKSYISQRGKPLCLRSIEVELICLRGLFLYLYRSDLILRNPMEDVAVSLEKVKRERAIFGEEEIGDFLDSIPIRRPNEQRNRAFFELAYSCGLRISEIRNLELEYVNLSDRILLVKGKGKKERYVPFSELAMTFLVRYIGHGRKTHLRQIKKTEDKKYVFLSSKGRLGEKAIRSKFKKYLEKCNLDNRGYTIHSIRHSTATHLLMNGASIRYVQELLGHESLKTTQVYTRPTEDNIKGVYRTYHPMENEYYREVDEEYLKEVDRLKEKILEGKEEYRTRGD